ncbi:MAG: hypothetical protein OXU71_10785 [Gammaproteobacteria bacterium]|nr:hypothetical protein [Gammaproteobacteria bacterium]
MTVFGKTAVRATEMQCRGACDSPRIAWTEAVKSETKSINMRSKVCPRSAYLGLCEYGLVKGVPRGEYLKKSSEKLNKKHAVDAVTKLRKTPELKNKPMKLWRLVIPEPKQHDGQMHVVTALWKSGLIRSA